MYDLVFLSYGESHAEQHWELLKERFPRAIWVKDVEGIVNAHQAAADQCRTGHFWVVDADNVVRDDFDFSFKWRRRDDPNRVAVWRASNNVNRLEYGYGGVKLLPRRAVLNVATTVVDFTTSISDYFFPMPEVASTTIINATPFEAWKAGFRECAKLASSIIKNTNTKETKERLETWQGTACDVPHAKYVLRGAREGSKYGERFKDDPTAIARINNWRWLRGLFNSQDISQI